MASGKRVVTQRLRLALELNWQFVILITLTLLHPGRSIISQAKAQRKSIHGCCRFPHSPFLAFPLIQRSFTFSYRLNTFSNSLALTPFHFSLHLSFVSHQWPSLLQHTDNLLGRDFHYLRSGTIYQGMVFSLLLWLTGGSSLYWILYSTIPFFHPSRLKSVWIQASVDVHRVVTCSVLSLATLERQSWQKSQF